MGVALSSIEAEGIFQKVKNNNDDQDYVEFVIGRFKTKLSRWHTLIINIIDELENGDGDSRVTDIFPKEGLEPSSDKKPTAQRLKGGFDDIEIEKTKFCRTPISAVEMDFGFVVKDKGSMDTSYPISCNWYREISTPDCLYPITWDKVAYSGKTFTPSEDDIDKRIMVKCYVGVKGRWYLADVTITNAVIKNGLTSTSSSSCLAALHAFASPINFLKKLFPIN
ncbi:hypothetical protein COLO4_13859 [Corchorus olitorius]|uniref:Uncharacterized protein n=1 Tax=Corchorus olitorius TaxID=93759 RepID=A0A1R3JUJ6_9ROSI|nr:hypothetical protein COLO4_13859 [Corchorus olitorius]